MAALLAELNANARALAESAENNPWIHEYRRVKAEVERTGDETLYADFQRRFKEDEVERERRPRL